MALDLTVRTATLAGSDMSWLGSATGTTTNRSITLDLSLFNFAATFTSKLLPSGVVLGKVTATGLYGPYNNGLSNGQETAMGFLFTDVDVASYITALGSTTLTGQKTYAALLIRGMVVESKLPTNHGLDAAAKVELKAGTPALIQFL